MTAPTAIEARELDGDDVEIWRALRIEGIGLFPGAFLPTRDEAASVPVDADRRMLAQGGRFGVFRNGQPVGIAALRREFFARCRHRASVGPFYVQPAAQGSGAAAVLMDAIENHARRIGVSQLELSVAADNARAIAFYQGRGFVLVGRLPNAVILADGPADDLVFFRSLVP